MQTQLADFLRGTPDGDEARAIVGKCVHCGFCAATCPTYRLLGDELDGPRGRIYLIKQVLEGSAPTAKTQLHLDRCLTCRACETTCPSGVEYGRLADIGRKLVDERVQREPGARLLRATLRAVLPRARLFGALLHAGRLLRPLLPAVLAERVPARQTARRWPERSRARKVLLLAGCVQPSLAPNINGATARVLDALGIEAIVPKSAGCCGAVRHHLGDQTGGLADARRNIDAWWPHLEAGVDAVVMNASGCGSQVREYGHLLLHDAAYAARAARVSAATCDVAELVATCVPQLQARVRVAAAGRVVFHPPCTLQHGQKVRGTVESLLSALGAEVLPFADAHLCCGGAGTYSILQPVLATQLRERKLEALLGARPDVILTANVGCIAHLGMAASIPVRHWIEWVDEAIST